MYEDNEGAKELAENPQGSHHSKHIDVRFPAGACEVVAGNNPQCSLGETTCSYPYEATRARGVPEAT